MEGSEPTGQGEIDELTIGDADVEEDDCEDATEDVVEGRAGQADEVEGLTADEEAELDDLLREAEALAEESGDAGVAAVPPGLGGLGGGFAGSETPIQRAIAIGRRNRLTLIRTKSPRAKSGSDHHPSQTRSFAADLSNGSNPTPEMDRTCAEIARLLGHPEFRAGVLNVNLHGYRVQMLYRTNVGGNHFNHVHVGVRVP